MKSLDLILSLSKDEAWISAFFNILPVQPAVSCTTTNKVLVRLIRRKSCQRPPRMGQDFRGAY